MQDVPLGTGILNASTLLAELKRQKFKGVLTLEYESWGSKQHQELVQCVEFLNSTCTNLVKLK
jgi:sugar phosphate isomerase/epimerase